jgi:hypothetical protein
MTDEKLRGDVMRAFGTARELYGELIGEKSRPIALASRVATDDDIRDKVREAIEDLRNASERLQGKRARSGGRKSTLLITGLARAMTDEKLRGDVMRAFGTARELYGELLRPEPVKSNETLGRRI